MLGRIVPEQNPLDAVLAELESKGGWRVFMKDSSAIPQIDDRRLSEALMKDFPNAALAIPFYIAKMGDPMSARAQLNRCDGVLAQHFILNPKLCLERILIDAHISVYEDKVFKASDARALERVLTKLPGDDFLGQALACNHLCTIALHMGNFDKAQDFAEQSIRLFLQGDAQFGSLHLYTHLGQIRLMRGNLHGAEAQFKAMEDSLKQLSGNPEWLIAVSRTLRAEVAYEMNDLARAERLMEEALGAVEQKDAWFDILISAYRVRTRLAYARGGLPAALEALSHGEKIARERRMPRLHRLMQIERVRVFTLSYELDAARAVMLEIGLVPDSIDWEERDDWALRQGTTFVAMARWMVRAKRAKEALEFIGPAEDFAIRGGQLLSLAKLRAIAAMAYWRLGARSEATNSLLSSIRLLGQQPFRRFLLDEGTEMRVIVQAALDGGYLSLPLNREQRRRLSELLLFWSTQHARTSTVEEKSSGVERQQYLSLLAQGHTNKEMARTMGVSVNTIKYHLKSIYRDLDVQNRTAAVQRARDLDMI